MYHERRSLTSRGHVLNWYCMVFPPSFCLWAPGLVAGAEGNTVNDERYDLKTVSAALPQNFSAVRFRRAYNRNGVLRVMPVLILELEDEDLAALKELARETEA